MTRSAVNKVSRARIGVRPHRGARMLISMLALAMLAFSVGPAWAVDDATLERWVARAGQWREAGRTDPARELYYRVLRHAPAHPTAYEAVWDLRPDRRPVNRAVMDRLAEQFPEGYHLQITRHHMVVYNTSHHYLDTRLWLLERARTVYYRVLKGAGFPVLPLAERLVVVLFDDHAAYTDYAQRTEHDPKSWTGGYYAARTNRIVLFNSDTAPTTGKYASAVEEARNRVQRLRGLASGDPRHRGRLAAAERELRRVRGQFAAVVTATNRRQTLHEAVHQLAFNSGLQRRGVQYPLWFSEGLATCFESHRPANPFGPAHDNRPRRKLFTQALKRGEAIGLQTFIKTTAASDHDDIRQVEYAQAWALFQYLFNHHRQALIDYVVHMRTTPPGPRTDDQRIATFQRFFGDLARIENGYQADIRARD